MSTFRKSAIVLAVSALASSTVGQAEILGNQAPAYHPGFNGYGGPAYTAPAYSSNDAPFAYNDNGYAWNPGPGNYYNGYDQPPPYAGFGGFGGNNFSGYDMPGYGAPQFGNPPHAQYGAPGAPHPGYGGGNPQPWGYGNVPPGYGNPYAYNPPPYPGFDGPGYGNWNDGPWNYGGPNFGYASAGYGQDAMPYGPPPGYPGNSFGQPPVTPWGMPGYGDTGYGSQPYAGFGGPANWGPGPGGPGWGGAPWGGVPNGWGNGFDGYYNYGPNTGRQNGNGWGFQNGWG